ncbi:uncharacterized protein LOC132923234 [Rhopalosiphum padi]|uniref:uncharacterized protein LOC132923234 n=1 Tax=Rhopalosiphum padi TaxID=40932 RepID=UPI00298EA737|nr:uncharacterized protein LOC132923234 [Rhopalosiphum padi]
MGSFTGKMLISAVSEYQLLYSDLKMVPHIYLVLVLIFWLFVATPMPTKLEAIDGYLISPKNTPKSRIMSIAWDVKHFFKKHQPPTIKYTIRNQQFWVGRFLANIPISSHSYPTKSVVKSLNWLYNRYKNWILGVQNVENIFIV